MTHKELVKKAGDYILKKAPNVFLKCQYIVSEFSFANSEHPDVWGLRGGQSVLLEIKVSRADFLKDKKKFFRVHDFDALGQQRYFVCPKGLIKIDEVGKWGLIEYLESTESFEIIKKSDFFEIERNSEIRLLYSILRRNFKTGYLPVIDTFKKVIVGN